jgi:hypothetical protein
MQQLKINQLSPLLDECDIRVGRVLIACDMDVFVQLLSCLRHSILCHHKFANDISQIDTAFGPFHISVVLSGIEMNGGCVCALQGVRVRCPLFF